jgi:hypothetical protein
LSDELRTLLEEIEGIDTAALSPRKATTFKRRLLEQAEQLSKRAVDLDPISQPEHVFDPGDPNYMGRITAATLLVQRRHRLADLHKFYGSGVYAIYYTGGYGAYRLVSATETPLYVGKSDPKSFNAATPIEQGTQLHNRLNDHKRSISKAVNLELEDFSYRCLVTISGLQVPAETYLIHHFEPIWNKETKICYGMGKHGDDPDRRKNTRSPWDTLHSGRNWATNKRNVAGDKTPKQIIADIQKHFIVHPPISKIDIEQLLLGVD